ncbi:hypothetical protein KKD04_02015 [Patescibacteria group bacterium]|nr:hypothetical protein [Patescibacteria group bacterium]
MNKNNKNKKIDDKIDDLARMIQGEFVILNKKIESLRNEILELRSDIDDIKLRMGNMAFRFEIKDIERRLRKVEIKSGINR